MALDYLDFEYSEDEDSNGTWDAMASVHDSRWPALLDEVCQVLHWAEHHFGGHRAPLEEGGDWDYDLSAQDDDNNHALRIRWNEKTQSIEADKPQLGGYTTLTLTLTGTPAFSDALQKMWELE